jgi:uncharacterized coiled-coil protein SlyX
MIAAIFDLTDVALILAAVGYVINRIAEARGWTRSSQVIRRENEDLGRRNADLEHTMERQTGQIEELTLKVGVLEAEMSELRKRDQTAVLNRLVEVEDRADARHSETVVVLEKIARNTEPPVHTTTD